MASELFVVGISWRTAPVAEREKLAFRDDELPDALAELLDAPSIDEAVLLSTCNRVEIYGVGGRSTRESTSAAATAAAREFLARSRGVPGEHLASLLYEHTNAEAVGHVFRVAASLDSLVMGESQILGQLKSAYGSSVQAGATGPVLGRWLDRAFGAAKRVRTETGVSRGAANVSSVAVELAKRVFVELTGKTVLVVGAGKMSALAARHLRADGAGTILVTNRSPARAESLADEVDGVARPWDQLPQLLSIADVVISSTAAQSPILTKKLFKKVTRQRRYQPMVVIDIAVPRDAEASIGKLDGVYLFDIDDLEAVVAVNMKDRAGEAETAQRILEQESERFRQWLRTQHVVPTIRTLRKHFSDVARQEVEKTLAKLPPDASPEQREQAMRRLGDVIVNKLLHSPMTALKGTGERDIESLAAAAEQLFDLTHEQSANKATEATEATEATDTRPRRKTQGSS